MLRAIVALLTVIVLTLLTRPAQAAEPGCLDNPTSIYGADAATRYRVIEPCKTIGGQVIMAVEEAPELGGEIHLYLQTDPGKDIGNGWGWADVEFADTSYLPPFVDLMLRHVTVTGAKVWDATRNQYSLKPAWRLWEYVRQYNERRADGSWWLVTQWTDRFMERTIPVSDYVAAGIANAR